jgi:transposase
MASSKYTKEFRDSTVQLVINGDESVLKIAADLDVKPKTLYNWIKTYKESKNIKTDYRKSPAVGTSKETAEDELKRLRAENKLLKQERDILKKATAYFAKETL